MSFISPYALLFFGKSELSTDGNHLQVDQWININIDNQTNELINELKAKFNYLLEKKALKKNVFLENEENLIETIIHFITKQDQNFLIQNQLLDHRLTKNSMTEDWDEDTKDLPDRNFTFKSR